MVACDAYDSPAPTLCLVLETLTFPVAFCEHCGRDVLIARDLNEEDELIDVCSRCDQPLEDAPRQKKMGGWALRSIGYDVEGEGPDQKGCGSGGSCSGCKH